MAHIEITVADDRTVSGPASVDVPPGAHIVQIGGQPGRTLPTEPFDIATFPVFDFGPWPEGLGLRWEDLYGDDGR